MGNADSHSSFVPPAKSCSSSLRCSSRREEAPSARGWWRSNRSRGRRSPNQPSSWHYDPRAASPQSPFGYPEVGGGSNRGDRTSVSGGSPKVLLSKDGSMRVEFTGSRVVAVETQGLAGLPAITSTNAAPDPAPRTSKGSSLSSDGSWYDSPWGGGAELNDNVFLDNRGGYASFTSGRGAQTAIVYNSFFPAQAEDISPGFSSSLLFPSNRTEDSGLGDSVLRDFSLVSSLDSVYTLPAFPAAPASSKAAPLDDIVREERGGAGYSSLTLPCRRAQPFGPAPVTGSNRKDFLKSRIRQLSDWTGSLSRKKRRIQEPHGSLSCDVIDHDAAWSSNPLHPLNQIPPLRCGSSGLNVYRSFTQEPETGWDGAAEWTEPSEEEVMDGEAELGGAERLDVLLEEEQGAVRRAGWLGFKPLLSVSREGKLELVSRRKWRRYWVTLKGCSLLFHESYGRSGEERELSPRYSLRAHDGLVQAVPEHPRREHVFCLSNGSGDVFLFQASSQTDLETWVTSLHSASASLLARRQGKEDTPRLLRLQSRALLHSIDTDGKMKKMAELQLSVIKEPKNRKAVESQIQQWEQNLEKLNLDLFRLRCYLSSLQGSELPNPKSLLAVASRPSKSMLGRLGVFSVSSFHALVCSRDEATVRRRCHSLSGGGARRRGLPSSLKTVGRRSEDSTSQRLECVSSHWETAPSAGRPAAVQESEQLDVFSLNICRGDAAQDFGFAVTGHVDGSGRSRVFVSEVDPLGLSSREGLRAGDEVLQVNGSSVAGLDLDLMQSLFSPLKLRLLLRRDVSPEPEGEEPDLLTWTTGDVPPPVIDVEPRGQECVERRQISGFLLWMLLLTMGALCWVLPAEEEWEVLGRGEEEEEDDGEGLPGAGLLEWILDEAASCLGCRCPADRLVLRNMERVYSLYRTFPEGRAAEAEVPKNPYGREAVLQTPSPAHLSVCQRLRKVIQELVDTEKSYVKDLACLLDVFLTPLQNETFLSKEEMEALFGSLPPMLDFQRVFLQTLEEKISSCPNLGQLETPEQFKTLLFSLGGSFLYYADHFKLYSGFCANHIKVQKVLERAKTDGAFKHFLETRNPTNQHSSCLESYLIKPVQRVLKYPLLLRELVSLTHPESPEHTHLTEALRAMEKVASHINEMQKIYEDYGCVFEQLAAEQSGPHRHVSDVSMGDFLAHSSVVWLNPLPGLRRLRKDPELTLFVFRRAVILVCRESSKLKRRMTGTRSADPDPFRFRWLIPVSAVQLRPANAAGAENPCVWELVHSRSEVEGRPETVFQLCSSGLETKASVLRVLRSILGKRAPSGSLRRSDRSWRRSQQRSAARDRLEETCSEPLLRSHAASDSSGRRTRLCSLTGELEAQLQRLNFTEGEEPGFRATGKRRSSGVRRGERADLSGQLERDFSVQSMTSIISEECFYDSMMATVPTLQS